ncbi:MAG: transketolase [Actinobacteria bacterium]|nr:transketolase [Actinomycetota bacterium]
MDAPAKAKSGHPGTAMALAPLAVTLFSRVFRHDPTHPGWLDRDRFILSCGHASILQYGIARVFGYGITREDLLEFRQPHSRTPGHPEVGVAPTVEVTTGPLGQGIANGVGMALAERFLRASFGANLIEHHTWVIAGDGCIEEGISHEAASLAGSLKLAGLTVIYDDNRITIDGETNLALADDTPARFRAYGWNVIELGEVANDCDALEVGLRAAKAETQRPTLLVLRSHIGFPALTMIDRREAHGSPFSAEVIRDTKVALGLDPDISFNVADDLPSAMVESLVEQRSERTHWEGRLTASGELGVRLLAQVASGGVPTTAPLMARYEEGTKVATRKAMQRAIDVLAPLAPGLLSGSADLTDNTGVLLPNEPAQSAENPGGRQIYYGIREFAMGAAMVGMALHGGVRPVGSTFFVFSDYVRPAIRLAALSEASVTFVFTHDSIGVGEDGPTHQPVEHLMALRAMPGLHVVRPSDANEALQLIGDVMTTHTHGPTALILSRQDLPVLRGSDAENSTAGARRGGYILRDHPNAAFTLVATGSEVGTAVGAADELEIEGINVRIVALPCWECFEEQPKDYRQAVIRRDIPSLSIEAGATLGWAKYADESLGIDTFGISAPADFVFEYFNLTPSSVAAAVRHRLEQS